MFDSTSEIFFSTIGIEEDSHKRRYLRGEPAKISGNQRPEVQSQTPVCRVVCDPKPRP